MPPSAIPEIVFLHLPRSDALETAIRRRAGHLTQYCDDLRACRVVVEQPQRHHRQGRLFEVRVDVRLTGLELVADRARHEDVYVALRDAFDGMTRQLEDAVRRRRAGPHHRDSVRGLGQGALRPQSASAPGPGDAPGEPAPGPAAGSAG